MKNSTTNYLRLIEVTLGICSFEITMKNYPKHLRTLDPNYSLCKAASKIAVSVLWLNIAPWAVKAPQYSLHCECISNPISPKGLGDTPSLFRERQDQELDAVGCLGNPRVGRSTAWVNKWLITWMTIQRYQGCYAHPATLWGLDVPVNIASYLCPLGGTSPKVLLLEHWLTMRLWAVRDRESRNLSVAY